MPQQMWTYECNRFTGKFDNDTTLYANCGPQDHKESMMIPVYSYTAEEHAEVERLRLGYERYEKLRRLNVPQFEHLYKRNIKGEGAFDSLVDAL